MTKTLFTFFAASVALCSVSYADVSHYLGRDSANEIVRSCSYQTNFNAWADYPIGAIHCIQNTLTYTGYTNECSIPDFRKNFPKTPDEAAAMIQWCKSE